MPPIEASSPTDRLGCSLRTRLPAPSLHGPAEIPAPTSNSVNRIAPQPRAGTRWSPKLVPILAASDRHLNPRTRPAGLNAVRPLPWHEPTGGSSHKGEARGECICNLLGAINSQIERLLASLRSSLSSGYGILRIVVGVCTTSLDSHGRENWLTWQRTADCSWPIFQGSPNSHC